MLVGYANQGGNGLNESTRARNAKPSPKNAAVCSSMSVPVERKSAPTNDPIVKKKTPVNVRAWQGYNII